MPRANGITRQEILLTIKSNGSMTAEELSQELNISQVAVRQHLASLEAERVIAVTIERRGLGRPSHRYKLTVQGDETFPRRYDGLTNTLLDELQHWQGEAVVQELFERNRERERHNLQARLRDKPVAARINEVARTYTENGFMAEACEVETNTFLLTKRNCAFCSVARNHPEVCCQGEVGMLQSLFGNVEIRREKSILDGDHACEFHVRVLDSPVPQE